MSTFQVDIEASHRLRNDFRPCTLIVDTGATYSVLPASVLREMEIQPDEEPLRAVLANNEEREYQVGEIRFRIAGRERTSPVLFGDEGSFLLGAVTLEGFGLIADTTHHALIPAPNPLLVGVRVQGRQ